MNEFDHLRKEIFYSGFAIVEHIYTDKEVIDLIALIDNADKSNPTFRKTNDLFAIREFLKEIPEIKPLIFTSGLVNLIKGLFGNEYFVVKSIYFDKPEQSNWFVAWHQDLTISVDKKVELPGYSSWTRKLTGFAVQPPVEILKDNFTIRIHLNDTNADNGALKVLPGSHAKNIYRPENIDWSLEQQTICAVKQGGIMIMRPLLIHASDRTTNDERRRVIHLEFSRTKLPAEIDWSEFTGIN